MHVRRADGAARVAEFRSTVIRDGAGTPTHTLGIGRDVTERAMAEQRLQESERRFREMADAAGTSSSATSSARTPGSSISARAWSG